MVIIYEFMIMTHKALRSFNIFKIQLINGRNCLNEKISNAAYNINLLVFCKNKYEEKNVIILCYRCN